MDKAEYKEYLHEDHWREVCYLADLRAIRTNGGKCERCHRNPIECHHHWTYRSLGREQYSLADVLACCSQCHAYLHYRSNFDPADPLSPSHGFTPDVPRDREFTPDPDAYEEYGQGYMVDQWGIWQIRGKVEPRRSCVDCKADAEALTDDEEPICRDCLRNRCEPD